MLSNDDYEKRLSTPSGNNNKLSLIGKIIKRHWCSGNINAFQAFALGSIPEWRNLLLSWFPFHSRYRWINLNLRRAFWYKKTGTLFLQPRQWSMLNDSQHQVPANKAEGLGKKMDDSMPCLDLNVFQSSSNFFHHHHQTQQNSIVIFDAKKAS